MRVVVSPVWISQSPVRRRDNSWRRVLRRAVLVLVSWPSNTVYIEAKGRWTGRIIDSRQVGSSICEGKSTVRSIQKKELSIYTVEHWICNHAARKYWCSLIVPGQWSAVAARWAGLTCELIFIVAANVLSMVLVKVGKTIVHVNGRCHIHGDCEIDGTLLNGDVIRVLPFRVLEIAGILVMESWRL